MRGGTLPSVTLKLERASLRDVLPAVDEALGAWTELKADGSGWVVRRVVRLEDVVELVPPTGRGIEQGGRKRIPDRKGRVPCPTPAATP